jgi:hypothetical protein
MSEDSRRRAVHADHGRTVQTVFVNCVSCGSSAQKPFRHDATDAQVKRECFPRWQVKGVNGALKTLCPRCR